MMRIGRIVAKSKDEISKPQVIVSSSSWAEVCTSLLPFFIGNEGLYVSKIMNSIYTYSDLTKEILASMKH